MLGTCLMAIVLFATGINRMEERLAGADHIVVGAFSRHTYEVAVPVGENVTIHTFRRFKVQRVWRGTLDVGDTLWFLEPGGGTEIRSSSTGRVIMNFESSHGRQPPLVGQRYILLLEDRAVGPYAGRKMINEKWQVRKSRVFTEGGRARGPEEERLAEVEAVARRSESAQDSR